MSSYQFVNSLAQCYADQQAGQNAVSQSSQDYYGMSYPNCYSPNITAAAHAQQYGQYTLMMGSGGSVGSAGANSVPGGGVAVSGEGGVDGNTSISGGSGAGIGGGGRASGNGRVGNVGGPTSNGSNSSNIGQSHVRGDYASTGQRGNSANQSPSSSNLIVNSSCKYHPSAATPGLNGSADSGTNLGSPQDLSRASDSETPQPSCQSLGPKTPESQPPLSPALTASSPGSATKSQNDSIDHRSSTATGNNTTSSNKSNSSNSSDSKSSPNGPPHIYPWMKRVHLGQSCYNHVLVQLIKPKFTGKTL
ncbi:hypothetical protein TCAL_14280 [Tigriopus californicus]|uniref:Homeobox domain-containing protein n=1 Tax=Tigriopus californicus TaxID=6832 RepID=A0A553NT64_TIGCA|nr:hypothetical protein TCAL_14280 [Tigriopus californicus]